VTHLWYAAYGSNLCRERFQCYLTGGCLEGAIRELPGCSDPSDPIDDRPWTGPGQLVFAKHSTNWGGGVGFLDVDAQATAFFRLYLITEDQFAEVHTQEGRDFYPLVAHLGDVDGFRIATVTDRTTSYHRPSPGYLRYVLAGLQEAHGLTRDQAQAYLDQAPGMRPELS
jgi:hypothetical protein